MYSDSSTLGDVVVAHLSLQLCPNGTSSISVVTGSTSLTTAPLMFQFLIDPRIAVATNIIALTFMSAGGTLPFLNRRDVIRKCLPVLISLTLLGSLVGAFLLLLIPARSVSMVVSIAAIAVAVFALIYRKSGAEQSNIAPSAEAELAGYLLAFLLGISGTYGTCSCPSLANFSGREDDPNLLYPAKRKM
jgi:uncharacterized protein